MKLVNESVDSYIDEGVADKYAAKKFGIQDPEDEFEKEYQGKLAKQTGEIVGSVKNKAIIKNPGNLKNFPASCRGVITKDGDLYMVPDAENVIHQELLKALKKKGIIKVEPDSWEDPMDITKFGFLTVQRVWNMNSVAIGESMMIPKPRQTEEREAALKLLQPYFKKAEQKNLQIKFINNQVRIVAKRSLSPEEYTKYKTQGS